MPNIMGYDFVVCLIWFAYTVERQNEAAAIFVLGLLCEAQTGVNVIRETKVRRVISIHFLFD